MWFSSSHIFQVYCILLATVYYVFLPLSLYLLSKLHSLPFLFSLILFSKASAMLLGSRDGIWAKGGPEYCHFLQVYRQCNRRSTAPDAQAHLRLWYRRCSLHHSVSYCRGGDEVSRVPLLVWYDGEVLSTHADVYSAEVYLWDSQAKTLVDLKRSGAPLSRSSLGAFRKLQDFEKSDDNCAGVPLQL